MVVCVTTDDDVFDRLNKGSVIDRKKLVPSQDMFIFAFDSHGRCEMPQTVVVDDVQTGQMGIICGCSTERVIDTTGPIREMTGNIWHVTVCFDQKQYAADNRSGTV